MANKYHAKRTHSGLCQRTFDSKAEAQRGEDLRLLEMAGEISDLRCQHTFILSQKPKMTIKVDFIYLENGKRIFGDARSILTRNFQTKMSWLKQSEGTDVRYFEFCRMRHDVTRETA